MLLLPDKAGTAFYQTWARITEGDAMTETADDLAGWIVAVAPTLLFIVLVILGFRLPKKGSGWGIR